MSPKPPRKTLRWSLCGECTVTYSSIGQKIDLSRAKIKVYPIVCAISYNLQYRVCSFNMFQPCATQTCSAGEEGWSCRFFRPPIFLRILLIDFHTFSILFNYAIPSRIVRYPPHTHIHTKTNGSVLDCWICSSLSGLYIWGVHHMMGSISLRTSLRHILDVHKHTWRTIASNKKDAEQWWNTLLVGKCFVFFWMGRVL